jgi:hypothetical protein
VTIFHFFQRYNFVHDADAVRWPQIVTALSGHGNFDPAIGLRWPVAGDSRSSGMAKALQEGGYHFSFFSKVQQSQCWSVLP